MDSPTQGQGGKQAPQASAAPARGKPRLTLVKSDERGLDAAAAAVLARLSPAGFDTGRSIVDIRNAYMESRVPLAGSLEPIGAVTHVHPAGVPPLTIFYPDKTAPGVLAPGLLYLHGGGWTLGGLETYEPFCRALSNATGTAIVWVEYRLAPEAPFPAAMEDSWVAARWLQNNAAALGIDPGRIAIGGDSAGGNLAAVTALAAREGRIAFKPAYQLLLYPCLDLTASAPSHQRFSNGHLLTADIYRWYRSNYLGTWTRTTDWRVSPMFASRFDGLAPSIVLTAGFDPLRDEGLLYVKKLRAADVRTVAIHFPRMIHGFLTMRGAIPAAHVAIERIASVIDSLEE